MSALIPDDYAATLDELKRQVHAARFASQRTVNTELLLLWWHIGNTILERQQREAWGSGVLTRLADDLRAEFPSMKGFSLANLFSMRHFASAWPDRDAIVQQPVGQLPSPASWPGARKPAEAGGATPGHRRCACDTVAV
jgi:predicted nuclease of restriction endonuclease-like (RecB) superfamily